MTSAGWTRTTCPYCGVGCGVLARPRPDGSAEIKGDPEHPANFGRLCSKGSALGETMGHAGRLLSPMIGNHTSSWDAALDLVASKFSTAISSFGPDSVAFYVSGQLLTEDYYVANKFMKGFIGSANIDTNSRLCMASSVAGHKRAFGSDTVPGSYEDIEHADLVVLTGSNLAWCHPVLYQRLAAAREKRGTKIVVIDPRRTATCDIADFHLAIAPDTDVAIFNALLAHLAGRGGCDETFVGRHTTGLTEALVSARSLSRDDVARICDVTRTELDTFFDLFALTERTVTIYSQGVNQSSSGTDKVNAIINCHLLTGRIGRPGMGPFSVTGQPNAMGGREVGGLANMLAAHMELTDTHHRRIVQDFWRAPRIASKPGLKAIDLFKAVGDGRIKALWIMATNPVDSLPDADAVKAALRTCPFVVISDVVDANDTLPYAHVRLPALAWGEKDGTVTNSERRISRQRPFVAPPAGARADWWQLAEVAKRMGHREAFGWQSVAEIYREHAALSGVANQGTRDFDISADADIDATGYAELAPFQWPSPKGEAKGETRFFAKGKFFTSDQRARFVPVSHRPQQNSARAQGKFLLNTGRLRDQWHTMTRTGRAPRLLQHVSEPMLEMHPADMADRNLRAGSLVRVTSACGQAVLRLQASSGQRQGEVFAPIHWTDQFASAARIDALVAPNTDPHSGQPASKATPVDIEQVSVRWHAFAVTMHAVSTVDLDYFALAPAERGTRIELAGAVEPIDWEQLARRVLGVGVGADCEILAYHDTATRQHRIAAFSQETLVAALFAASAPVTVSRTWLLEHLGKPIPTGERLRILAGRPGIEARDRGPIVCACFEVGRNDIIDAIVQGKCRTVASVGERLGAGNNCGSCRPEIGRLIKDAELEKAV